MAAIILGQARAHPPAGSLGTDRARLRGSGLAGLAAGGPASGCPRPKASGERGRIGAPRSPLEDSPPPPPPQRPAQVRFPAQATGTATLTEVEADSAARGRERGPGGAPSLAQIHPRASPGARARGLCALQLRKPGEADRSALAANSSAVRPPSWACSVRPPRRRPPTRKLALPGRGGENAGGGEPASPAAPRQWQTSRRPRSSPGRD